MSDRVTIPREVLARLVAWVDGLPVKHPQQAETRDMAMAALTAPVPAEVERASLDDILAAHQMEVRVLYEALERALSHFAVMGTEQAARAASEIEAVITCPRTQPHTAPAEGERNNLMQLFRDHYWGSFEDVREYVLKHVESVLALRTQPPTVDVVALDKETEDCAKVAVGFARAWQGYDTTQEIICKSIADAIRARIAARATTVDVVAATAEAPQTPTTLSQYLFSQYNRR